MVDEDKLKDLRKFLDKRFWPKDYVIHSGELYTFVPSGDPGRSACCARLPTGGSNDDGADILDSDAAVAVLWAVGFWSPGPYWVHGNSLFLYPVPAAGLAGFWAPVHG
jgi:hypothetical protein